MSGPFGMFAMLAFGHWRFQMDVNVFLAFIGGLSVGILLATLISAFMFAQYKHKSDEIDGQIAVLNVVKFDRISAACNIVAGMIYDYASGLIPSIEEAIGKGSFPKQQLTLLSILFSWICNLDSIFAEDEEGALTRIVDFQEFARDSIVDFKIEVNATVNSWKFTFSWKGISAPFTLTPR